ncbi:hypothetical protein [Desulforhopalus sp. IMCC35007]|uniref:hypothetical protein n=1 Tax=Desulforhopalus sp. IMCC35007 TaxID=2569543 RepID=UPI0010AEDE24|nr:hypothetical protein [Desulforhopalus sp. IMCC35007]TKB07282.1 hypothetical protein FCL48_17575 [Desulforhopalus sp. IMCC35007]
MILHPGIIGLLVGSVITLLMVFHAAVTGAIVLYRWDFSSSSQYQLSLERKTYLVSTLVNYGLAFQVASAVLFVYTVDDIHQLFVGAMCATGSLNANPIGWYALLSKIAVLFLSGFWLALNYVDSRLEESPYVKLKYGLLIGLFPFLVLDLILQFFYFLGLDPAIITSCCGSLFGGDSNSVASSVASVPVVPAMIVFYLLGAGLIFLSVAVLYFVSDLLRYLYAVLSASFFVVSIVAIISFVSIYIYELPTHHCPFDMLQRGYHFVGYPLYFTLFLAVYFGMLPGLFCPLKRNVGMNTILSKIERPWIYWCLGNTVLCMSLVTYTICFSNLTLFSD